jgi:ABC-type transport system substrate-binding protein
MSIDRDLSIDVRYESGPFKEVGLPVQTQWHSHLPAVFPEWVDPKGSDLGEGAKYFQHNPAEARKLVEAAGHRLPLAIDYGYWNDTALDQVKEIEVMQGMIDDAGAFSVNRQPMLYATEWTRVSDSGGELFGGILAHRLTSSNADIYLTRRYTPAGKGTSSKKPIPIITDLVLKQRRELDPQRRLDILKEIQKAAAMEWPDFTFPGLSSTFSLSWPWLANHGVFGAYRGGSSRLYTYAWYDESKRV